MNDATSRRAVVLPTGRFAAAMAAGGLALLAWPGRSWAALGAVEAGLTALLVVDAVRCPSPRRIDVVRDAPAVATLGDRATMTWVVGYRGAGRARVVVADALWPSLQPSSRRFRLQVAGGTRARVVAHLRPSRRGTFPLGEVTVRTAGPWGLACRQAGRTVAGLLRVMPAYPSRDEVGRRITSRRLLEAGARSSRSGGAGTEFDQLREHRPDDEFRRIDWAASVRLQRPIVRQYRSERNQTVIVLLDNGRVMAGTVGEAPRVEHAMDAALAVTHAAAELGDRVGLLAFDRQVRSIVVPMAGRAQLGRVAEAMFALEPELAESAYASAFSEAIARFRRRALFVVLTDLVEAAVEEALLPALPILTRRHLVLVAGVRDPRVAGWAAGGLHEWPSEAFREAAAVAALAQRARAVARLRAAGAVVVDAAPGRLGVAVVDEYLAIKSSGRL